MFWLTQKERPPRRTAGQLGPRMRWFSSTQKHVDTVVFVHGILGHYARSWGHFPRLLIGDPDLPEIDILLWGYRTGFFSRHNRLQLEAGHLITALECCVNESENMMLVGHSMGGLIILKALVDRMAIGHAQQAPCRAVSWISLFASPLNGVWLAGILRGAFLLPMWLLRTLHKHLHDLSTGPFVKDLMSEVRARIYEPAADDAMCRRIPIRIIAATQDLAVDRRNRDLALTEYKNPSPLQLDESHTGIKLPTCRQDARYRVLAADLQSALTRKFKHLCSIANDRDGSLCDRIIALDEILRRYGKLIRPRLADLRVPRNMERDVRDEFLLLIAKVGATSDKPIFMTVSHAMMLLKSLYRDWQ